MENYISINFNYDEEQRNEIDKILTLSPKVIKTKLGWDDQYYQTMVRFFTKQKKNGYIVNDNYTDKGNGRCFGKSTTLQSVDNKILSNLFSKTTYDIDMENASFKIASFIINREFKNDIDKFPLLLDYAENREKYYSALCDKQYFISSLFCSNPLFKIEASNSKEVNNLLREISAFQELCGSNLQLWRCDFKNGIHLGKKISKIIFYYENKILQDIACKFKEYIKFLKFDGLGLSNKCDLENVLLESNICSGKYNIKMIKKDFPEPIFLEEPPKYEGKVDKFKDEYLQMKLEFEKEHFMTTNPVVYYNIWKNKEISYNKMDFKDLVSPYTIDDKPFFDRWIKDNDRRCYKEYIWFPKKDLENINYNSFKGFVLDSHEPQENNPEVIEDFSKLLLLLVNNDIPAQNYLIKYFAHLFQFPERLAQAALIFKGEQGVGKDLMIDILEKIIGEEYVFRDGNMENIVGNFNQGLKHKLIVQLNEVSGKDGHFHREALKDIITKKYHNINEKYSKLGKCQNFNRVIFFTNNLNAIHIPYDDRRYNVFQTGSKQPRKFYDPLYDILENKDSLKTLYNYFINYDISNFAPDKQEHQIKTEAYEQLKDQNRNPFYEYLYILITELQPDIIKHDNKTYITTKTIENGYRTWLYDNEYAHITPNSKNNRMVLQNLDCKEFPVRIDNHTKKCFLMDFIKLKERLDKDHKFGDRNIIII